MTHARPQVSSEFVAPKSDAERKLATVVLELLGIDRVGVRDSLFELGFNSLLVHRLVARARQVHRLQLGVGWVFDQPTIGELGRLLDLAAWASASQRKKRLASGRDAARAATPTWQPQERFSDPTTRPSSA